MNQTAKKPEPVVGYEHTESLTELFRKNRFSLVASTYQAQRILVFTAGQAKLSMLMRCFERPTGMAICGNEFSLYARNRVWRFVDSGTLRDPEGKLIPFDRCFVPRTAHITGDVAGHEIGYDNSDLILVNTRFSCLCKVSTDYSFTPIWQPSFIDSLVAEDRCHLNGVAIDKSGPSFVTALGATNTKEGWRATKASAGIIIDVKNNKIITRDLCMPHSPRLYRGKLWVLESGKGKMLQLEPSTGVVLDTISIPGYLRGLAFFDRFAFVGTCMIREKKEFGGLPIEKSTKQLVCSIQVIDIDSKEIVGFIRFTKGIEELFDLVIIPNSPNAHFLGFEEDTIDGVFVMP